MYIISCITKEIRKEVINKAITYGYNPIPSDGRHVFVNMRESTIETMNIIFNEVMMDKKIFESDIFLSDKFSDCF